MVLFRLVLVGNETVLQSMREGIVESLKGVLPIGVVGLDMEGEREAAFDEAVNGACSVLGTLDAFVHAYSYEGTAHLYSFFTCIYLYLEGKLERGSSKTSLSRHVLKTSLSRHVLKTLRGSSKGKSQRE